MDHKIHTKQTFVSSILIIHNNGVEASPSHVVENKWIDPYTFDPL